MANTFLTISMITREALRVLENNLAFAKGVNRNYDEKFAVDGAKIGNTLNIRKPARFLGRTGATLAAENYTESSVPLVLNTQFGVDINFVSSDLALNIDDFSKRYLQPAMATVANKVDRDGMGLYKDIYNQVGNLANGTPTTLGTGALRTYLSAGAKMDYEACPRDGLRSLVVDPQAQVEIVDSLKSLFQSGDQIMNQYESGNMGQAAGFKWSMDQNTNVHIVGAQGGTPVVAGAAQTGSTLLTSGWTASTAVLKKGDVFTLANVFAVNPQSRVTTGQLRQFTVTADSTSDGSGNLAIPISPALVLAGSFQTVTVLPANLATLIFFADYQTNQASQGTSKAGGTISTANLAYHRDAFAFACADLPLPGGVDMASRVSDKKLGMSVRMVRAYDINNDAFPCRIDVLYGWKTLFPELACRIQS